MKKHLMWVILGAIILVEIIIYFTYVSPQAGLIEEKTKALKKELYGKRKKKKKAKGGLKHYVELGGDLPAMQAVNRQEENRNILEAEYNKCLAFYKLVDSQHLKKWFLELGLVSWNATPTLAQFQSQYKDQFARLAERCKKNNIEISNKSDETLKLTSEESKMVAEYRRLVKQLDPTETSPMDRGGGFWETNQLTQQNVRTAQKQYWIQEEFVNALIAARGSRLVYVSFHREAQPARAAKKDDEKAPKDAIEQLMERIPVTVVARMHYGSISAMLNALTVSGINMEFKGLKVVKPPLAGVKTKHWDSVTSGVEYKRDDEDFNGVFPKIMDKDGGVDFGEKLIDQKNRLPGQDKLLDEPPVLVEFSYDVLDVKGN